jgi:hypothetical protein
MRDVQFAERIGAVGSSITGLVTEWGWVKYRISPGVDRGFS